MRREQYRRIQQGGRRKETRNLVILYLPNRLGRSRLGISASKKFGNSVQRNRIKRLVRELFRRNRNLFPPGSDIVVIPKKGRGAVDYWSLLRQLQKLGRRSGG